MSTAPLKMPNVQQRQAVVVAAELPGVKTCETSPTSPFKIKSKFRKQRGDRFHVLGDLK